MLYISLFNSQFIFYSSVFAFSVLVLNSCKKISLLESIKSMYKVTQHLQKVPWCIVADPAHRPKYSFKFPSDLSYYIHFCRNDKKPTTLNLYYIYIYMYMLNKSDKSPVWCKPMLSLDQIWALHKTCLITFKSTLSNLKNIHIQVLFIYFYISASTHVMNMWAFLYRVIVLLCLLPNSGYLSYKENLQTSFSRHNRLLGLCSYQISVQIKAVKWIFAVLFL